jgi:cytochrome c553
VNISRDTIASYFKQGNPARVRFANRVTQPCELVDPGGHSRRAFVQDQRAVRPILILVAVLAYVVTAHAGTQAAPGADGNGARIWNGVYTAAQVDQAKKPLVAVCRRCHNDDLGGSDRGPALHGSRFMATWDTQAVSALFAKVRDTMPPDSPSSLPDEDYINMVALILQKNGFPAGNETLSASKLDGILIVGKDDQKQVPNFRLVEVVGCLTHGPNGAWTLTSTSEPAVTDERPATAETLKQASAQPLGSQTFRLVSINSFDPAAHIGQKMQAKGLLYRAPGKDRINLIALDPVGPSCGP